jgi:SpoVK/Ycf46/Vps4 family AAA+-type ATPase
MHWSEDVCCRWERCRDVLDLAVTRILRCRDLAVTTSQFSGADLALLCRRAALQAMARHNKDHVMAPTICAEDFEMALAQCRSTLRQAY